MFRAICKLLFKPARNKQEVILESMESYQKSKDAGIKVELDESNMSVSQFLRENVERLSAFEQGYLEFLIAQEEEDRRIDQMRKRNAEIIANSMKKV
tara:strand:- start:190 stop:480 length:291 start_codon:yes stop_codon:yes gene_type:complete